MRELEALALALTPVIAKAIAAAVDSAVASVQEQLAQKDAAIAALSKRLDELPAEPEPLNVEEVAKAAAALVPAAEPFSVDLVALARSAASLVEVPTVDLEAVAALVPVPENGKDAEPVNLEAVAALVKLPEPEKVDVEAIARAAAALIPAPVVPEVEHGRDAIDLEILPAIDEAKQYPRGTYAAHRGGLWKSYERTHGMRGWECIVDGIDAVSVTQDAVREFSVALVKSSGQEVVQKFQLPIQVYKGVHREGEVYDEHDNVTWAGSQWTSTKAENTDKPGSSDAWQLTVKAGRPGKDLRENASTFDASKGVKL